jgi:hypothetical protein
MKYNVKDHVTKYGNHTHHLWKDKSMVFSLPLCQPRHTYFTSQSNVIISVFISIVPHKGLNMLIPLIPTLQLWVHQGVVEPPSVLGAHEGVCLAAY